jgi:hypothetical protein
VKTWWKLGELGTRLTGIPELVLMPAPVMTTTLRAFHKAFAMSCSNGSQPGLTWVVGILTARLTDLGSEQDAGEGTQWNGYSLWRCPIASWFVLEDDRQMCQRMKVFRARIETSRSRQSRSSPRGVGTRWKSDDGGVQV